MGYTVNSYMGRLWKQDRKLYYIFQLARPNVSLNVNPRVCDVLSPDSMLAFLVRSSSSVHIRSTGSYIATTCNYQICSDMANEWTKDLTKITSYNLNKTTSTSRLFKKLIWLHICQIIQPRCGQNMSTNTTGPVIIFCPHQKYRFVAVSGAYKINLLSELSKVYLVFYT